MKNINILDCTLRDGSYAINFKFTARDTTNISLELEKSGINWIEIGHGVGLGASEKGYGKAAEKDKDYMKAVKNLKSAKWGMFCIPGIGSLDMLKLAIDHGMGFVRLGVSFNSFKDVKPFIELARKNDLFTCVNFMKSYTSSPLNFAKYALEAKNLGANLIYIVDSAGGMLPNEIYNYIQEVRKLSKDLKLGFHGHNNLGLSIANSLMAIDNGVNFIDSSLQGLARGAGNTSSEQLICSLIKKGFDLDIDPIGLMDISEKYILPLSVDNNISSIDVISGLSLFHSSYMDVIQKYSSKYKVDPRRLIINVCKIDKINAPESLVDSEAKKLSKEKKFGNWKKYYKHYYGHEQSNK